MKHVKKNRGLISRAELGKIRSKARSQAKHRLSKKYKKDYIKIYEPIYRRLKREHIIQLKGGKTNKYGRV